MSPTLKKVLGLGLALLLIVAASFCHAWWRGSKSHSVTISWQAPASPASSTPPRYNIYRSDDGGTSYSCISRRVTGTTFQDGGVKSGKTYRYSITAVDEHGRESEHSVTVDVTVPK